MLNGFELNSVELNGGPIQTISAAGDAFASANAVGNEFVTRITTANAFASATSLTTAFAIKPHSGALLATASASAINVNIDKPGKGDAQAVAVASAYVESFVFAEGKATAKATLVGIPADEIGGGNAAASAILIADATKVRFETGAASASSIALNNTFDVVRNAEADTGGLATARGEPAVNDVIDASGNAFANAFVDSQPFVLNVLEGHASSNAMADGISNTIKAGHGDAVCAANIADADSNQSIAAFGNAVCVSLVNADAVRNQFASSSINSRATTFARAKAFKRGYVNAKAKATVQADLRRVTFSAGSLRAESLIPSADAIRVAIAGVNAVAIADAQAAVLINQFTFAPPYRTVRVQVQTDRIVVLKPEPREIRIAS